MERNLNKNTDDNNDNFDVDREGISENDIANRDDLDSPVNKNYSNVSDGGSLTNDEDADTDPNEVPDKPSFNNDNI